MDAVERDDQDDAPVRTANIPLRALWIVAVVLIAAGVASLSATMSAYSATDGPVGSTPIDFALLQTLATITPSLLTGGLVCVGLALAAHAIAHRDERVVVSGTVEPIGSQHEEPARPIDEPATTPAPAPLDHELFKRPTPGHTSAPTEKHRGHTAL